MQIAELIGLPGAGKTTVIRAVTGRLAVLIKESPSSSVKGQGLIGRMHITGGCPLVSLYFYGLVLSRTGSGLWHLRHVFSMQKRYLALYGRPHRETALVDEGVIHSIFSAMFGTRPTILSRFFLRRAIKLLVKKNARFYLLDIDRQTCAANFGQRDSTSRFSMFSNEHLKSFLDSDCYEEIVDVLRSDFPNSVVILDSTEKMVERLVSDFGNGSGPERVDSSPLPA